ncbi:MAG: nucleoside phosphorylase [Acidimicrobiales bacterium]
MPFPNFAGKHDGNPYVTPHRLLAYRGRRDGAPAGPSPRAVIVSWQPSLLQRVKAARDVREVAGPAGSVVELSPAVGFARLPIGAPAVGIVVEELAAVGVEVIVGVGTAGAIAGGLRPGDTVLCSAALRDEGVSHHYAPAARWAEPDEALLTRLRAALPDAVVGRSWTTDAPYRETLEEIVAYRGEGVLTVEMEAAALFTVSRCVGIRAASVFCISDILHGTEWEPHFGSGPVGDAQWHAFERVEAALNAR